MSEVVDVLASYDEMRRTKSNIVDNMKAEYSKLSRIKRDLETSLAIMERAPVSSDVGKLNDLRGVIAEMCQYMSFLSYAIGMMQRQEGAYESGYDS